MVVGEDARVTAYFFTTYQEAARLLQLAAASADAAVAQARRRAPPPDAAAADWINPWRDARISTVSLDAAVTLALKAGAGNIRNYFQVAPAAADIMDALAATGTDDLAEGKVPLFYYADFVLDNGSSPLYFQKAQLEAAYRRAHPKASLPPPPLLVTELFAVLTAMVEPGGTDLALLTLVFVPPPDSARYAAQCVRANGAAPPFVLGQRNIVL